MEAAAWPEEAQVFISKANDHIRDHYARGSYQATIPVWDLQMTILPGVYDVGKFSTEFFQDFKQCVGPGQF